MYLILLVGVALNYLGALKLLKEVILSPPVATDPQEYFQLTLFVIGAAATFGTIYLYLYFNTDYIYPFLVFGAVLKTWAFLTCLYLYMIKRIDFKLYFEFGILNGLVAAMFIVLLAYHV